MLQRFFQPRFGQRFWFFFRFRFRRFGIRDDRPGGIMLLFFGFRLIICRLFVINVACIRLSGRISHYISGVAEQCPAF